MKLACPSWTVSLPSDSDCDLTAAQNVGGRCVNDPRPIASICNVGATALTATGEFVHIEQARSAANYALWSQAVLDSFAPAAAMD